MDYSRVFAMKRERENRIKRICPSIPYSSGIYVFYRTDEAGINRAYCGQAVNLCERCASHLGEYDHIALSLKSISFTVKVILLVGNFHIEHVERMNLTRKKLKQSRLLQIKASRCTTLQLVASQLESK